tara:strand:- start:1732 stop:2343 length:612 start_codon:yes stop_codon:yes gene_type:complete
MTEEEIKAMQDKIAELTEANDKITKNRDDILGEKRSVQSAAAEKDEAIKLLAEEKLKLAGDMDGLKSLYAKNNAESVAKLQEALDRERATNQKADYEQEYNSNVDMFHDSHKSAGKAMLSNALKISYNDQGEKITSYQHEGNEVAKTAEEFKSFAAQSNDYKQYLKGVDSSGADTAQSRSGASMTNKPYSEMSLQERAKINTK